MFYLQPFKYVAIRGLQRRIQDFPDGRRQAQSGAQSYYMAKFRGKLHEYEENWAGRRVQNFTMKIRHWSLK